MAETIDTQVTLDVRDALKALVELGKAGNKTSKKIQDDFSVVKFDSFINIGKQAFQIGQNIANAFRIPIQEASAFEDTVQGLRVAFKLSGITAEAATEQFLEFADSIQKTTKFSDDATIAAASLIQSLGNLPSDELERATKAALDLSTALRIDLDSAARLVGKAAEGNVTAFRKYGIEVRKGKDDTETFANTLAALEKKFGGSAEESVNTYAGATAQLSNAMSDVVKQIGLIIIQNPAVVNSVKEATGQFNELANSIKENESTFDKFVTAFVTGSKVVAQTILGINDLNQGSTLFNIDTGAINRATSGPSVGTPERGLGGPDGRDARLIQQNDAVREAKKLAEIRKKQEEQEKKNAEARKKDADRQYADILKNAEENRKNFDALKGYGDENNNRAAEAARVTQNTIDEEKKARQQAQRDSVLGSAPGLIGNLGQGKAGVAGAASSLLSNLGPYGAVAGAAVQFLSQGPEAVRAQIQGFIDGVPEIITAISESIPVVVEVLAANAGKITTALSLQMPLVANTLAFELIKQSPNIALAFANSLINEASRIAQAIADAIKGPIDNTLNAISGGNGGTVKRVGLGIATGGISEVFRAGGLKFAEGGIVPGGAPFVDRIPIMATPQERVLNRQETADLEVLNKKVDSLVNQGARPTTAVLNIQMGLETMARALIEIDRRGIRTRQI
jgi:hypothetical protein